MIYNNSIPGFGNEIISHAAIKYDELTSFDGSSSPLVLIGHRHFDIIRNLWLLTGKRTVENGPNASGKHVQGFYTNHSRFVDREEAMLIAIKNNQLIPDNLGNLSTSKILYSEDLW